ncbi:DNA gyrase inhibitor YacG [Acidovorax sp. IB03]|uniref:DNA gyrase inhibitor YacG n=1 Tax=Acidovorax sp. IB03 TaxID=2779366 RepID=UPI0018E8EB0A|nr:DNA gyrase inhibitor YacG [Acidovorax sp. IB03]MBJ2164910.1 DNA gyrase inhibitor YacG [Acidovorax sp. IB03]
MASSKTHNEPSGQEAARTVVCPTCGGDSVYSPANRYRPFCSERCKQIDLGAWASEDFRMPAEAPPADAQYGDPRLEH